MIFVKKHGGAPRAEKPRVITLDFINTGLEPGARAGIELTLETAKDLRAALDRAIASCREFEEAEVRGKAAMPLIRVG